MTVSAHYTVLIESDRLGAAISARKLVLQHGVDTLSAAQVELCVSELAGNAARHASGGEVTITMVDSTVTIAVHDRGPGIHNLSLALEDGVSCDHRRTPDAPARELLGLGTGLGAVSRVVDRMQFLPREGGGLSVVAVMTVRRRTERGRRR